MAAPLKYLFITVEVVAFEEVYLSDTQNPKTVKTLIVDDKHYLLKRDNLTQPSQMQLIKNKSTFSKFCFCIFQIYMKF